jgi:hypothetical protein
MQCAFCWQFLFLLVLVTPNCVCFDECFYVIVTSDRNALHAGDKHSIKQHFLILWMNMSVVEAVLVGKVDS